jgi:hypothetical protein
MSPKDRARIFRLVIIPLFVFIGGAFLVVTVACLHPLYFSIGAGTAFAILFPLYRIKRRATEKKESQRGWRVGHFGRDSMFYDELVDGSWQRLQIDGEMLTGRAHHIIYFATEAEWMNYPAWAQNRRDEIISRIKSEFREPDYEYWRPETTQ